MSAAKSRYMPKPRGLTQTQAASRLGVSLSWFHEHKHALKIAGFPQPDSLTGRTDAKAIELWMDRRAGIVDEDAQPGASFDPSVAAVRGLQHGPGHA